MKKFFFTFLALIPLFNTFGQVDTIAENIYSFQGNLGIGIAVPEYRLTIVDSLSDEVRKGRDFIVLHNKAVNSYAEARLKLIAGNDLENALYLGQYAEDYVTDGYKSLSHITSTSQSGLLLRSRSAAGSILFHTGFDGYVALERMRITSEGNVGIGTQMPLYKLDVAGLISSSEGIRFPDGTIQTSAANGGFNNSTLLPERIHIGDTTLFPAYADGPIKIVTSNNLSYGAMLLKNPVSNLCTAIDFYNNKNTRLTVGIAGSENPNFYRNCGYIFMSDQNSDEPAAGLVIGHRYSTAPIIFAQNNEEVLRIDDNGYMGVGTNEPKAKVEIADGDIFISDINKGIIMKSPDGQCWRGTLDNSGTLSFVVINCEDLTPESMVNKSADISDLSIFPNPAQNTVTIYSQQYNLKNMTAILYTIDGKIAKKEKLFYEYAILKLNDIPEGTYIIKVVNKKGEEIGSEKIIKN